MKRKTLSIIALFTLMLMVQPLLNVTTVSGTELSKNIYDKSEVDFDTENEIICKPDEECNHSPWYNFDDEKMTVSEFFNTVTVETFLNDFYENHSAVVYLNGVKITDGLMQEGMIVEILHDDVLYGSYNVVGLIDTDLLIRSNSQKQDNKVIEDPQNRNTNVWGFNLPIDNMNLLFNSADQPGGVPHGCLSWGFRPPSRPDHNGIDVTRFVKNGVAVKMGDLYRQNPRVLTPLRATLGGLARINGFGVVAARGNYIVIDHGVVNGQTLQTLYAHMHNFNFSSNKQVAKGEIIGNVGDTGTPGVVHLHFEVRINGNPVNPINELQGATTYTGNPPPPPSYTTQEIPYGNIGDIPIIGDWNGDGKDDIGVYRPSIAKFFLRTGTTTQEIYFGNIGDVPIIGDWNGNGVDKIGVYRPSTAMFYLRIGTTTQEVRCGDGGDIPIIGDWNGNGIDKVGVYRPSTARFYLRIGTTTQEIPYGNIGDVPIIGDWNGNGVDKVGVYRPSMAKFFLRTGTTTQEIPYGNIGDKPITGDWNGNGKDKIGVYRPSTAVFYLRIY